jgi:hypothetical protein
MLFGAGTLQGRYFHTLQQIACEKCGFVQTAGLATAVAIITLLW